MNTAGRALDRVYADLAGVESGGRQALAGGTRVDGCYYPREDMRPGWTTRLSLLGQVRASANRGRIHALVRLPQPLVALPSSEGENVGDETLLVRAVAGGGGRRSARDQLAARQVGLIRGRHLGRTHTSSPIDGGRVNEHSSIYDRSASQGPADPAWTKVDRRRAPGGRPVRRVSRPGVIGHTQAKDHAISRIARSTLPRRSYTSCR